MRFLLRAAVLGACAIATVAGAVASNAICTAVLTGFFIRFIGSFIMKIPWSYELGLQAGHVLRGG